MASETQDTHIGEAGPHKDHTLNLMLSGRVYCVDCSAFLTWNQAEVAWTTGETWPRETQAQVNVEADGLYRFEN